MQEQGKMKEFTLEQVGQEHLRRLKVEPKPGVSSVVQLAQWAMDNKGQVEVRKKLRYPLRQFLERLELETPKAVHEFLDREEAQPLNPEELMGMESVDVAAECLEKVRLRMSAEGMLDEGVILV